MTDEPRNWILLAGAVIRYMSNNYIRIRRGLLKHPDDDQLQQEYDKVLEWFASEEYEALACGVTWEHLLDELDDLVARGIRRINSVPTEPIRYDREIAQGGERNTKGLPHEQICWHCAKADDRRLCCWADGKPRSDWDATPTRWVENEYVRESYIIHSCPAYEPDRGAGTESID